ncbi:MAG: hypothetical protein JST89_14050 [Cyanobacteria bacterium SZAS-4]|nr:hypothetical protein [Cyanobacteria bacterium SZAS-4]
MKIFQVFIPGDFIDAFAYRGRLLAIAADTSIHVLSMDKIATFAEAQVPSSIPMPDLLFARNNWMSDPKYRLFVRSPRIAAALLAASNALAEQNIECTTESIELCRIDLTPRSYHYPLDLNIYNGRLYIATEDGFYHQDFADWKSQIPQLDGALERRHDGHSTHTSAKYGTVNISCGSDGFLCALDEFQLRKSEQQDNVELLDDDDLIPSSSPGDRRLFKRFQPQEQAGMSFKSDWCNFDIVNYSDSTTLTLLTTEHDSKPEYKLEGQSALLQGFKSSTSLWDLPRSTDRPRTPDVEHDLIDHVFNADQTFYIHTVDGDFYSARMRYSDETGEPTLQSTIKLAGIRASGVCKTASVEYGMHLLKKRKKRTAVVVECFGELLVINDNGESVTLSDRPSRTVRTFPNSKQYQNLVVVARDDGLWLNTIFDDTFLKASELLEQVGEVFPRDGHLTAAQAEMIDLTSRHEIELEDDETDSENLDDFTADFE